MLFVELWRCMMNKISIKDDFARFALLTPEQQEWIESNKLQRLLVGIGKVYSCDQNNIDTAFCIAKIFPIRLRWWKQDRFGYWSRSTKHTASHFTIDCRLQEILKRKDKY